MFNDLNLILQSVFDTMGDILILYFAGGLFSVSFSIYIVRKIVRIINRLA